MMSEKIRVFVVDDHTMIRRGLAAMIQAEDDLALVGEAVDGADAIAQVPGLAPDVVLMDLLMPQIDGIAALIALKPLVPGTRFVVLTSQVDPDAVRLALQHGATSYLGRRALAPEATDALVSAAKRARLGEGLTPRELEVLGLMTEGLSNQDIAGRIGITVPTVKFHVTNILGKLQAPNRTGAVLIALREKLVTQRP
jgi:two-component system, NarL family, response regulator LiaR